MVYTTSGSAACLDHEILSLAGAQGKLNCKIPQEKILKACCGGLTTQEKVSLVPFRNFPERFASTCHQDRNSIVKIHAR